MQFKKLLSIAMLVMPLLSACSDDDDDNSRYYGWRDQNNALFADFSTYLSDYGASAYFNHSVTSLSYPACTNYYRVITAANEDSLRAVHRWYTPYYTSTLKVHYTLYDTESVLALMPTDAALRNDPAVMDSIFFDSSIKADTIQSMQVQYYENFTCSSVVLGWADLLQQMHIGDNWLVAIPWQLGYGESGQSSSSIDPYTTLFFRIQLCDITHWGGTVSETD